MVRGCLSRVVNDWEGMKVAKVLSSLGERGVRKRRGIQEADVARWAAERDNLRWGPGA